MTDHEIPYGYCHCGCGEKTALSRSNRRGYKKDEPVRFRRGHENRVRFESEVARIERFVEFGSDCWIWTGSCQVDGYGRVQFRGKSWRAHRAIYTLLVDEIPEGLVLDHLCRNPSCVNPEHLEPVTQQENSLRGLMGRLKTECPKGHLYSEENTYRNSRGHRYCRTCKRAKDREYGKRKAR